MTDIVTPPTIDPMAPAPLPTDSPGVFDSKAYARLQSEDVLVTQVNAVADATEQNAIAADERAVTAAAAAVTATTQAGIATTKAGEAAASAVTAATQAGNASTSFTNFDKRYLGSKASAPTLDNQGAALTAGALYFNTGTNTMQAWNGTVWEAAYLPASGYVTEAPTDGNSYARKNAGWTEVGKITRSVRTSNTQLVAADSGKWIDITSGTFTQTFAAAATLGDGWYCYMGNSGTGVVTLDPNAAETIDGVATKALDPGQTIIVQCDGAALRTVAIEGVGNHHVIVNTGNGHGSTNTMIRRFTTTQSSAGTAITYTDSVANGAAFAINEPGLYSLMFQEVTSSANFGISLNSAQLTTTITSITATTRLANAAVAAPVTVVARLSPGDTVRAHTDGTPASVLDRVKFEIRKVGI